MTEAQHRIPVKYVGKKLHWRDDLYGSLTSFTRGKVSNPPAWAAEKLLKHSEFQDARPASERGQPILAQRPVDVDEEMRELNEIDRAVRFDQMSRAQLATFAKRAYGVEVDASNPKVDVVGTVRHLARQRA